MQAIGKTQEVHTMREKQKEWQLLAQIAALLLRERLITPEEQLRFLANLKKEG